MRHGLIQEVTEAIENELSAANKAFPGFNSTHEGYAVILEEAQETEDEMRKTGMNLNALWQATRMNQTQKQIREIAEAIRESARDMAAEAIQTAAIQKRGTIVEYNNGGGQSGYKKNEAVDMFNKTNAQMLKLLSELGLKANATIGGGDFDDEL